MIDGKEDQVSKTGKKTGGDGDSEGPRGGGYDECSPVVLPWIHTEELIYMSGTSAGPGCQQRFAALRTFAPWVLIRSGPDFSVESSCRGPGVQASDPVMDSGRGNAGKSPG